jgi:hypothetical protein
MTTTCKNCNHHFKGNFCSNCGQTVNTHEINFTSILHEIQHGIFHIDKGILYTSKELFRRPGHTIREYLNGKRVKHFKPFAYIFILSTIYALLTKISHKSNFLNDLLLGMKDGATEKSDEGLGMLGEVVQWMANHYAYATLIIIPIISFSSYICFFKTKKNFFQHLILNSFVAGQRTVAFLILIPFIYFVTDEELNKTIETIKVFLGVCLTFWTYYQFFDALKPIKRILLTVLTYIVLAMLFILIVFLFVMISKIVAHT